MEEQTRDQGEQRMLPAITKEQIAITGGALLTSGVADLAMRFNGTGVFVGLLASFVVARHSKDIMEGLSRFIPGSNAADVVDLTSRVCSTVAPGGNDEIDQSALSKLKRLIGLKQTRLEEQNDEQGIDPDSDLEEDGEIDPFAVRSANDTGGVQRFTVAQIVEHCELNSYKIYVGRSLTQENNPAVLISIYKRHFRFMGASQRGKSSMVAAFLDIVTQTHDKKHVLLVILDKEDQTGNLFAHLPHIATLQIAGDRVKLHARTDDQVLEYLTYVVAIMEQRYKLSKSEVLELPILLTYVEEFLSLKNTFKSRIGKAKGQEQKEKAVSDYSTLVYCIEEIAQRGLKVRVQLLLCAQVEYADDDFKEALVNVDCGFSFCVRPTAAAAAGFRNNVLLQRNAKENKVGQAVVETPDCNDLVLSPEYPLEERLIALEKRLSLSPRAESLTKNQAQIEEVDGESESGESSVKRALTLRESTLPAGESFTFSHEDEIAVITAAYQIKLDGQDVTREAIKLRLGWNNKKYSIVKAVCDKHAIAKR